MAAGTRRETTAALAGFGAIGRAVAGRLVAGVPGLRLAAVGVRDPAHPPAGLPGGIAAATLDDLAGCADVVVECAPACLLPRITAPVLRAGRTLVVLSCGALLDYVDLAHGPGGDGAGERRPHPVADRRAAQAGRGGGGRRDDPGGAHDHPQAAGGARRRAVPGRARDFARPPFGPAACVRGQRPRRGAGFPANVNVAVALALAGIGPDRMRIEIWADAGVKRNVHRIEVDADAARFLLAIEGVPSENPRTGRMTPLSVVALLRKMRAALAVGT